MAEVVNNEPPVLIENVSVIINVFNIGNHGDLTSFPVTVSDSVGGTGFYLPDGAIETVSVPGAVDVVENPECSPRQDLTSDETYPLGWIAFFSGDVIPFGIQSIASEIPKFGDRKTWKEIRVCLPPSLLADTETDLYCPVISCREKLPRNKSMDNHIKKHLGLIDLSGMMNKDDDGSLPCPLFYYCQVKKCQYYVETAEKFFKAYKNVKQHYQKVHAPKPYECDMCQKTFSNLKLLETHKLMCGEKYSCSTCDACYTSLEALQTHCRRKSHLYDHNKYKDMRNSVKQEIQLLMNSQPPSMNSAHSGSGRRSSKISRKLPVILPKVSSNSEVFNTIQNLCQQAGVKVDYGCQTVCTAIVQKSNPVEAVVATGPPAQTFTQKKRKSTDTQTNLVKFRATCLDQKHNATNTNVDWKKVITSDSQTQTADNNDSTDVPFQAPFDNSTPFNDEFATIKISDTALQSESDGQIVIKTETDSSVFPNSSDAEVRDETVPSNSAASKPGIKVDTGPSLFKEFISFLEATDSATQTDPDVFKSLGGDLWEINYDEFSSTEKNAYVSVSSTASQTAVESVSAKSLSAEDYEALLNATDDKKCAEEAFNEYIKVLESFCPPSSQTSNQPNTSSEGYHNLQINNDILLDWENIVEEVYRDVGDDGQQSHSKPCQT